MRMQRCYFLQATLTYILPHGIKECLGKDVIIDRFIGIVHHSCIIGAFDWSTGILSTFHFSQRSLVHVQHTISLILKILNHSKCSFCIAR